MSIRVMTAVWDCGLKDQGSLLVLLAMADFSDDAGRCWPSLARIAEKARMSERNVRRVIRKLESDGYLKTNASSGRATNTYHILCNPDNLSAHAQPGHLRQSTRTNEALNPDICDTNPDTAMSAEPSIEPSRTVREPSEGESPSSILCELAPEDAVESFLTYRRKSKWKALTATGARRLAKGLEEIRDGGGMTDDALAMAEERGWATVKPDWYFKETRGLGNGQSQPTGSQIAEAADAIAARWGQR